MFSKHVVSRKVEDSVLFLLFVTLSVGTQGSDFWSIEPHRHIYSS